MEYEELRLLKQSEKSTTYLVRQKDGEQLFIRKILKGQRHIYQTLQSCKHPYLPVIYEVAVSADSTTVIEEYVEGQSLEHAELSEKQACDAVKELCSVLEFLHEKNIIHRDIKPSNMILAKDGHIRLIDFDAARVPKDDLEQDTSLLGTPGYAPPEQYGFAQTDARTDIYALGITIEQLLGDRAKKLRYRRIIQRCTDLDPDRRYQSVRQVKNAFLSGGRGMLYGCGAIVLLILLCFGAILLLQPASREKTAEETLLMAQEETAPVSQEGTAPALQQEAQPDRQEAMEAAGQGAGETDAEEQQTAAQDAMPAKKEELITLPAPKDPHWDGETGVALWGNVPESGTEEEVAYSWKLYRSDTALAPDPDHDTCYREGGMRGNGGRDKNFSTYDMNLASELGENGYYYFAVSAVGDGVTYADSPYAVSDAFEYTGEAAPELPAPTGLSWEIAQSDQGPQYYAVWSNLKDYADADSFNVCVYDGSGNYVTNNIWTKEFILSIGHDGIWISPQFLTGGGNAYRFTVEAYTSRPNEYRSASIPDPVPEEAFSPWLTLD